MCVREREREGRGGGGERESVCLYMLSLMPV